MRRKLIKIKLTKGNLIKGKLNSPFISRLNIKVNLTKAKLIMRRRPKTNIIKTNKTLPKRQRLSEVGKNVLALTI